MFRRAVVLCHERQTIRLAFNRRYRLHFTLGSEIILYLIFFLLDSSLNSILSSITSHFSLLFGRASNFRVLSLFSFCSSNHWSWVYSSIDRLNPAMSVTVPFARTSRFVMRLASVQSFSIKCVSLVASNKWKTMERRKEENRFRWYSGTGNESVIN